MVGDTEQDRFLGGRGASLWLDVRFRLAVLLLRPFRKAPAALALVLGVGPDYPGR